MSNSSTSSLARSSAVMAAGTLVSRVLGLGRMALLAYVIGNNTPTGAGDVWETANTIPNTIYLLLAAGVLNVLLLPQLTRAMTRGREGQEFSDRLITLALVILAGGTALFILAAPLVTKLNALAWAWDDPKLQLAILFAYLCIPQMLFYGVHTLLGQILAAHHRFAAFMWSPALANIIAIGGLVIFLLRYSEVKNLPLQDWTPGMITLLAGSATLGIVVQALVLIPAVRATGFTWRWRWGFRGVGLGTASVMAGWAIADVALSQGGMLVVTNLLNYAVDATPGVAGKNAFTYAFAIFVLPHSLIALSLLTAIYPVLSKDAAADRLEEMAENTSRGMRLLGAAMVPIAVGMLLLAPLLVRVIYPASTPSAHASIAAIVIAMVIGLVPYGVYLLCARVFYSFEDARTPFFFQVAITSVLLTVCVIAVFQPPARVAIVLGLGQALGQGTAAVLGLRAVRRRLPTIGLRPIGSSFLRSAAAAVISLVPVWLLVRVLDRSAAPTEGAEALAPQSPASFTSALIALGVAGPLYLLLYAVIAHRLGVKEVSEVAAPVLRRIPGLRRMAPDVDPITGKSPAPAHTSGQGSPSAVLELGGPHASVRTQADAQVGAATRDMTSGDGTLRWDGAGSSAAGEDSSMDRLEVGTLLGDRYALDELLAEREGGGLQYWSARDVTLGRLVAVTALPSAGEDATIAEAVLDGARRVASIDDPRLVRVLDVGEEDELCWIIEEGLSEAESLASLIEEHPLPPEEARRIVGESAAALESARRRGLHHLYLNPHAVLRTSDGAVKVSGVGVASALEGTDDVTADEASLIDSADLISLLYTGLTGRWPGEDLAGVRPAKRLSDGSLPAPSEVVAGVPGDLDALCRLAHGSDADLQRAPHTPGELTRQLAPWASEQVHAPRPGEREGSDGSHGADGPQDRADAALSGAAGAAAATSAVQSSDRGQDRPLEDSAQGRVEPRTQSADATAVVPRPPLDTGQQGGSHGTDKRGRDDDTMGGLLAAGTLREDASPDHRSAAADAGRGAPPRRPTSQDRAPAGGSGTAGGLREERGTGPQTILVMLITFALLAVAVFLGWTVLRGLGGDEDQSAQPSAEAPSEPAAETEDGPADETEEPPAEDEAEQEQVGAVSVLGITSFDPQGDGDERNDLTPLAVDGDTETEWTSHTYLSPGWGSLKDGTGLILDLGEDATVAEVEILLGEGDMGATLYLTDSPSLDDAAELASDDGASGTWTVSPEEPASGRYLILWFTRAWTSPAGEIVSVREISVS